MRGPDRFLPRFVKRVLGSAPARATETAYLAEVRGLPRPTDDHVDEFVEYVADAHSWYKHLPLLPPGEPFVFYLNPNAGREWVATRPGRGAYRDRTIDTPPDQRFHYTWQPTSQYIERFGHLDYFADAGTSFVLATEGGVLDTRSVPRILTGDAEWIELPDVLLAVGTVPLTASVHWVGQEPFTWIRRLSSTWEEKPMADGPGAEDTVVARIRAIACRYAAEDKPLWAEQDLDDLHTKWLPALSFEQKRQMGGAIRRVLEWVYDA